MYAYREFMCYVCYWWISMTMMTNNDMLMMTVSEMYGLIYIYIHVYMYGYVGMYECKWVTPILRVICCLSVKYELMIIMIMLWIASSTCLNNVFLEALWKHYAKLDVYA